MPANLKRLISKKTIHDLYQIIIDFLRKCNDDHVSAFGAMSAFFILLSLFPFLIFLLTLTKYMPFSKDDIQYLLAQFLSFEDISFIERIMNEVYQKISTSVFTISILTVLWSSSKGIFSIVKGLNAVFEIKDRRNYFVLRIFSLFYTVLFACVIVSMLIAWVFGNQLLLWIATRYPFLASVTQYIMNRRTFVTFLVLVFVFMLIYYFLPDRASYFYKQFPGAVVAAIGWMVVSRISSIYVDHFHNFTYIYGSVTAIMILLLWLYFCMSMVFYGAEVNYFLESKQNLREFIVNILSLYRDLVIQREEEAIQELEERKKEEPPHVSHR